MRPEEAWQSALGEIELNMGKSSFVNFLKGARLVTYEDGQFVIGVSNGYVKEWMELRKQAEIKKLLTERMGRSVDLSFVVVSANGSSGNALRSLWPRRLCRRRLRRFRCPLVCRPRLRLTG
jgi:chromosomal replication initiation ATPase DnaA